MLLLNRWGSSFAFTVLKRKRVHTLPASSRRKLSASHKEFVAPNTFAQPTYTHQQLQRASERQTKCGRHILQASNFAKIAQRPWHPGLSLNRSGSLNMAGRNEKPAADASIVVVQTRAEPRRRVARSLQPLLNFVAQCHPLASQVSSLAALILSCLAALLGKHERFVSSRLYSLLPFYLNFHLQLRNISDGDDNGDDDDDDDLGSLGVFIYKPATMKTTRRTRRTQQIGRPSIETRHSLGKARQAA